MSIVTVAARLAAKNAWGRTVPCMVGVTDSTDMEELQALLAHGSREGIVVIGARDGAQVAEALQQAAEGHRVLVFCSPGSRVRTSADGSLTVTEREERDPARPHVAVSAVANGRGACEGYSLAIAEAGAFDSSGEMELLATYADGAAAAVGGPWGAGCVAFVAGSLPHGSAVLARGWAQHALGLEDTRERAARKAPSLGARALAKVTLDTWRPPSTLAGGVNDPILLREAGHAGRTLPEDVYHALIDFADGRSGAALLVQGCPIGDIPATPPAPHLARKNDLTSETTLLTVARMLGQPVGYEPEHGGDLVQNVCPVRAHADRQTSTSSAVVLELHTEAAFHPVRPRYLALLCLRGDPASATTLASVGDILSVLDEKDRLVLSQPRFTTGVDESYTGVRGTARSARAPILDGHPESPRLWLDNDLMKGTDPEAQAALERAAAAARQVAQPVVLKSGDLLIVDNDKAVHGRTPFTPRFDGTDRWLQRVLIVGDHRVAGADLSGRIVTTRFNTTA